MFKTFQFKEGTVIAEVSEEKSFNLQTRRILDTGRFTACLIGGTAGAIRPAMVKDARRKAQKIFRTAEAAFKAAFQLALNLGCHRIAPLPGRRQVDDLR